MAVSYIGHSFVLPNWFVRRRGPGDRHRLLGRRPRLRHALPRPPGDHRPGRLAGGVLDPRRAHRRDRPAAQRAGAAAPARGAGPASGRRRGPGAAAGGHPADVVDSAWASVDWTLGRAVRTARFWWVALGYFGGSTRGTPSRSTRRSTCWSWASRRAGGVGARARRADRDRRADRPRPSLDRVGREWAWTGAGVGYVICYASLLALPSTPSLMLVYTMVAAQGLLGYGLASVFGPIPLELFQGRHFGTIFGTLNLAARGRSRSRAVGDGLAPRPHRLRRGVLAAMACSVVSIAAMWQAAPRKVRAVAGRTPRVAPALGGPARGYSALLAEARRALAPLPSPGRGARGRPRPGPLARSSGAGRWAPIEIVCHLRDEEAEETSGPAPRHRGGRHGLRADRPAGLGGGAAVPRDGPGGGPRRAARRPRGQPDVARGRRGTLLFAGGAYAGWLLFST